MDEKETPVVRVNRIADQLLDHVDRYEKIHEPRAVFAYAYWQLTTLLAVDLTKEPRRFFDAAWVATLCERLAAEYFVAMSHIDKWLNDTHRSHRNADRRTLSATIPQPQPWRDVYAAQIGGQSYVVEDLLFSMMAHISYDLPVALDKLASSANHTERISDFHCLNDVLGNSIDEVQDKVFDRYCWGLEQVDRLLARQDELLSNYGIRLARAAAWYNYERLQDHRGRTATMSSISRTTGELIANVRRPDYWPLRLGLTVTRRIVPRRRQWPRTPVGNQVRP
jgi:hypothetical protein